MVYVSVAKTEEKFVRDYECWQHYYWIVETDKWQNETKCRCGFLKRFPKTMLSAGLKLGYVTDIYLIFITDDFAENYKDDYDDDLHNKKLKESDIPFLLEDSRVAVCVDFDKIMEDLAHCKEAFKKIEEMRALIETSWADGDKGEKDYGTLTLKYVNELEEKIKKRRADVHKANLKHICQHLKDGKSLFIPVNGCVQYHDKDEYDHDHYLTKQKLKKDVGEHFIHTTFTYGYYCYNEFKRTELIPKNDFASEIFERDLRGPVVVTPFKKKVYDTLGLTGQPEQSDKGVDSDETEISPELLKQAKQHMLAVLGTANPKEEDVQKFRKINEGINKIVSDTKIAVETNKRSLEDAAEPNAAQPNAKKQKSTKKQTKKKPTFKKYDLVMHGIVHGIVKDVHWKEEKGEYEYEVYAEKGVYHITESDGLEKEKYGEFFDHPIDLPLKYHSEDEDLDEQSVTVPIDAEFESDPEKPKTEQAAGDENVDISRSFSFSIGPAGIKPSRVKSESWPLHGCFHFQFNPKLDSEKLGDGLPVYQKKAIELYNKKIKDGTIYKKVNEVCSDGNIQIVPDFCGVELHAGDGGPTTLYSLMVKTDVIRRDGKVLHSEEELNGSNLKAEFQFVCCTFVLSVLETLFGAMFKEAMHKKVKEVFVNVNSKTSQYLKFHVPTKFDLDHTSPYYEGLNDKETYVLVKKLKTKRQQRLVKLKQDFDMFVQSEKMLHAPELKEIYETMKKKETQMVWLRYQLMDKIFSNETCDVIKMVQEKWKRMYRRRFEEFNIPNFIDRLTTEELQSFYNEIKNDYYLETVVWGYDAERYKDKFKCEPVTNPTYEEHEKKLSEAFNKRNEWIRIKGYLEYSMSHKKSPFEIFTDAYDEWLQHFEQSWYK